MFMKRATTYLFFNFLITFIIQSSEQYLFLNQIIDSARFNHPILIMYNTVVKNDQLSIFNYVQNTELSLKQGYIYSPNKESEWKIRQQFNIPVDFKNKKLFYNEHEKLTTTQKSITEKTIFAEIKKAYYECLFQHLRFKIVSEITANYENFLEKYFLKNSKNNLTEINELALLFEKEKLIVQENESYHDLLKAESKLRNLANLKNYTLPADTSLEIYEIEPMTSTLTRTPANLFNSMYESQLKIVDLNIKSKKNDNYPRFYIEYAYRQSWNKQNFSWWQIGILLQLSQYFNNKEIQNAKLEKQQLNYVIDKNILTIKHDCDSIIIMLNKLFTIINHYRRVIIPISQKIESIIINNILEDKNIPITDFQLYIQSQLKIVEYYEYIKNYNTHAISLELYAY